MTKPRFDAAQHTALGASLTHIRDMIQTEKIAIETAFPTTTGGQSGKAAQALLKALQQVDEARWAMENVMFEDIPGSTTDTYSGRTQSPTAALSIEPPDGTTILAARHLDATEGRVRVGSTVDAMTRAAIDCVLDYVAKAHNTRRDG